MGYAVLYEYGEFTFTLVGGSYGVDLDGVMIPQDQSGLDAPEFIVALKNALMAYPQVDAVKQLEEHAWSDPLQTPDVLAKKLARYLKNASNELIDRLLNCAEIAEKQTVLELQANVIEFITALRAEYDRRKAPIVKPRRLKRTRGSNTAGYVYVVQSTSGAYKIGRTKNLEDRLQTFSVKLPFEVEYLCTIQTADMYGLENQLHRKFEEKRINGEWFALDLSDIEYIRGLA